ncbi:MAG: single-stranded DNA-binding protein [Patescibacteria group bacterium]
MNNTNLTIVGFVTADPELKTVKSGFNVVNMTIASTPSKYDSTTAEWVDGTTLFLKTTAWRGFAENISNQIKKGDKVIASGKLIMEEFTDKDGNNRQTMRLDLESLGLDLSRVPKANYSAPVTNGANSYQLADPLDEESPF